MAVFGRNISRRKTRAIVCLHFIPMPIQKNPLPAVNKKIGEKDMGQITENNKRVLENSDTYSEKALTGLFDKYTFAKYLSELIDSKHIKIKDIIQFSNISKTYISDLRDMSQNKQPGRNKLLDLALGIHADMDETNHLLRLAGYHELDSRGSTPDRIMIWGLSHKKTALEIREVLCENGHTEFALNTDDD